MVWLASFSELKKDSDKFPTISCLSRYIQAQMHIGPKRMFTIVLHNERTCENWWTHFFQSHNPAKWPVSLWELLIVHARCAEGSDIFPLYVPWCNVWRKCPVLHNIPMASRSSDVANRCKWLFLCHFLMVPCLSYLKRNHVGNISSRRDNTVNWRHTGRQCDPNHQ